MEIIISLLVGIFIDGMISLISLRVWDFMLMSLSSCCSCGDNSGLLI